MIKYLSISNFYSIKEPQELDLALAKNTPDIPERFGRPIPNSDERIPRVIAIFGPNASGKTNVLRAISFLKWFVTSSFDLEVGAPLPYAPFLTKEGYEKNTQLIAEVDGQIFESQNRCVYRYEVEFYNRLKGPSEIASEMLAYAPKGRFRKIFERNDSKLKFGDFFDIKQTDPRRETIRPNASLISTFAKFGHPMAAWILGAVNALQTNVMFSEKFEISEESATQYYSGSSEALSKLNEQIRIIDLGIEGVKIENVQGKPTPHFTHSGLGAPLSLLHESRGTRNFYRAFPYLNFVLNTGGIAVLDEFDSDIHPLLLPEIVSWFCDERRNLHNAQLIISCHNATLLEHLVKEEVFFTEKNVRGETEIYGLKNIQGVRRDTNIYSKYLGGVFGAVPHIG